MSRIKASLPDRPSFQILGIAELKDKWIFEPALGEENFVGALFTLCAHLVDRNHPLYEFWSRPLTFKSNGIDAVSCTDDSRIIESLQYLEYKHTFSPGVEFNHPFSITDTIICWDFKDSEVGASIADSYDYLGSIASLIKAGDDVIGFKIGDIRLRSGLHEIGKEITVLSLFRLMGKSFTLKRRTPPPKNKAKSRSKS